MDLNQIKKVADSLSKLIDNNEKVSLTVFAHKLSRANEVYPEDHTIGMMSNIVSRMENSNKLFITRAEIKDLYNRLYSRNTKFADLFKDELGVIEKTAELKTYDRNNDDEDYSIINRATEQVVDPILKNALNVAFGNETKYYDNSIASKAKDVCTRECEKTKLAFKVDVVNGNEKFIICRASFETPKGQTAILIPIEIVANKTLLPNIFVCNSGPEDFSTSNIKQYLSSNTGVKLNINDSIVLKALNVAKDGNIEKISNVDLAVIKLAAAKETQSEYFSNNILMQKVAGETKNLELNAPKYKDSEFESFAKQFDSPAGVANFKFGKEAVNTAKNAIENNLLSMNIDNVQIAICDTNDDTVVYAVRAGKVAFKVPIKMNGKFMPSLLISNGSVMDFSKNSIMSLFKQESQDYKTSAFASPMYSLKASELVQIVRNAMIERNFAKAEDALNVLSNSNDDKAYKTAFVEYTDGLSGVKTATKSGCTMIVKNAHSKHELCGHTGLPLHKVFQNKTGECCPVYRQGMSDTQEGAYFLNSKIFF